LKFIYPQNVKKVIGLHKLFLKSDLKGEQT